MFSRFKRDGDIKCPIVMLDPHVTSPGQEEPVNVRNESNVAESEGMSKLYERANEIYHRAKRMGRRRSAGII